MILFLLVLSGYSTAFSSSPTVLKSSNVSPESRNQLESSADDEVASFAQSLGALSPTPAITPSISPQSQPEEVTIYPDVEAPLLSTIIYQSNDPKSPSSRDLMYSFSAKLTDLSKTQAFKHYIAQLIAPLSVPVPVGADANIIRWLVDKNTSMPESLNEILEIFKKREHQKYFINLASFTGGGAKGLMEILAVTVIEEYLNAMPDKDKQKLRAHRVEKYWLINAKTQTEADANIADKLQRDEYIYFQDVVDHFAGTSTGSIIAAGLAYMEPIRNEKGRINGFIRYKAYQIAQLYYRHLKEIFTRSWTGRGAILGAPYTKDNLTSMLKAFFGDKKINDVFPYKNMHIILTKVKNKESCISIACADDLFWGDKPLYLALEGSASAPTFFGPIKTTNGHAFVDGGLRVNAPVEMLMKRVIERNPSSLLRVISFGAGNEQNLHKISGNGSAFEAIDILKGGIDGQVREAHENCLHSLENSEIYSLYHINPLLKPGMKLDSVSSGFIQAAFSQTFEEMKTSVFKDVIKSLCPTVEIPIDDSKLLQLYSSVTNKVKLLDFSAIQSGDPKSTTSQIELQDVIEEHFETKQKEWLELYIKRVSDKKKIIGLLLNTVKHDPFGVFKKQTDNDIKIALLSGLLHTILGVKPDSSLYKKCSELIKSLPTLCALEENVEAFGVSSELKMLLPLIDNLKNETNIEMHGEAIKDIMTKLKIDTDAKLECYQLFYYYKQKIWNNAPIAAEKLSTLINYLNQNLKSGVATNAARSAARVAGKTGSALVSAANGAVAAGKNVAKATGRMLGLLAGSSKTPPPILEDSDDDQIVSLAVSPAANSTGKNILLGDSDDDQAVSPAADSTISETPNKNRSKLLKSILLDDLDDAQYEPYLSLLPSKVSTENFSP